MRVVVRGNSKAVLNFIDRLCMLCNVTAKELPEALSFSRNASSVAAVCHCSDEFFPAADLELAEYRGLSVEARLENGVFIKPARYKKYKYEQNRTVNLIPVERLDCL